MYSTLLILHSILRWGVLLGGLYAITKSVLGLINKREFTAKENRAHVIFVMFCHTQLLVGLILLFSTPNKISMDHVSSMILGVGLIQAGRILSKKGADSTAKHKRAVIWFSIGFLLILSRIPWGSTPMFRGM